MPRAIFFIVAPCAVSRSSGRCTNWPLMSAPRRMAGLSSSPRHMCKSTGFPRWPPPNRNTHHDSAEFPSESAHRPLEFSGENNDPPPADCQCHALNHYSSRATKCRPPFPRTKTNVPIRAKIRPGFIAPFLTPRPSESRGLCQGRISTTPRKHPAPPMDSSR